MKTRLYSTNYKNLLCFTSFLIKYVTISMSIVLLTERGLKMIEYRYDTQLLIEGKNLNEDAINDYFTNNFKGDCLLAVGDDELIKIHYHTNEPWYCCWRYG